MKDLYEIEEKLDHLFERVMKLEQAINGIKTDMANDRRTFGQSRARPHPGKKKYQGSWIILGLGAKVHVPTLVQLFFRLSLLVTNSLHLYPFTNI